MKDRLKTVGRIGTALLTVEIALAGCGQTAPTKIEYTAPPSSTARVDSPNPTQNQSAEPTKSLTPEQEVIQLREKMRNGIIIDATNFNEFFTKCESKDQLIQTASEQRRQFFPLLLDDPNKFAIKVDPFASNEIRVDWIQTDIPITYISPIAGGVIDTEDVDSDSISIINHPNEGIKTINSVTFGGLKRHKISEIEAIVEDKADIRFLKNVGDKVKKGEPVFTFYSSPVSAITGLSNAFIFTKVEYQGENAGYYSSDLSTYATFNGKIQYCSSKEIPIPN